VQPVDLPGAEYADERAYGAMTYGKAEAVFWMLRDVMGAEPMRQALRYYYEQNRLGHVREEDLRAAMERFHPAGLRWFFHQWLHTTARLDYALGAVDVKQRRDGQWEVRVEVVRTGDAWMPVTLQLDGERHRLQSPDARQWVTLVTASRPQQVTLDPDGVLLETDVANNARVLPPGGP
jgi:aminopeptidase N